MKEELLKYLLGDNTIITYIAAFVFVFFGVIIKLYLQIKSAVKTNENTPSQFSWNYFLSNNLFTKLFSILANFIICFVALRFATEIFNVPISMIFSLTVGLGFDVVVDKLRSWQGKLKDKV